VSDAGGAKKRRLLVTADEAGLSREVNAGIREARERGIVTQASVVATGRAVDEAAAWLRSDPAIGVGAHLDLVRFFQPEPRPSAQWAFQDPRVPVPAILEEIAAQFRALAERRLSLSFVTSRHHLHLRPELLPLVCDVALAFGVKSLRFWEGALKNYDGKPAGWLRETLALRGLATTPHFIDGWYWGNVDEPFACAELACRPSQADDAGRRDVAACCDPRLREHLASSGIELAAFRS
jgi:predicted glycoside hydrolase/deacetylase ChbG (UPF0249 family)